MALPEWLLLWALWVPAPGCQPSNSAGSGNSCQNQGECLGKPVPRTEPAHFGRQPGCAAGQEEELRQALPLAGPQPPQTASDEAKEI